MNVGRVEEELSHKESPYHWQEEVLARDSLLWSISAELIMCS